ncbi:MAG: ribonuclease P protein subunit [Candidatus Micrarchaeaceae archaeon]|jgi:ribonuclease P protein subunit POP4
MHGYNNKNIVLHELIGLDAEVIDCRDRSQIGIKGKIINETKNLLYLKQQSKTRRVVKNISKFKFTNDNDSFIVDGKEINFRAHERTEKALKFYKRRKLSDHIGMQRS